MNTDWAYPDEMTLYDFQSAGLAVLGCSWNSTTSGAAVRS